MRYIFTDVSVNYRSSSIRIQCITTTIMTQVKGDGKISLKTKIEIDL